MSKSRDNPHVSQIFLVVRNSILDRVSFWQPREDATQLPELVIHFVRRADCLHHFMTNRGSELPAQTMNLCFYRTQPDSDLLSDLLIRDSRFFSGQKR